MQLTQKLSLIHISSDDDEIAAEAKDGAENLSDEEYARRLREEGGK